MTISPLPRRLLALALPVLALSACAQPEAKLPPAKALPPPAMAEGEAPLAYAALGETVPVDGPRVTPLEVLEDSRCPMNARCVWAGQVRLRIRVDLGSGSRTMDIVTGTPLQVADGSLELLAVRPERMAGGDQPDIAPADYRFGFRFMGGI